MKASEVFSKKELNMIINALCEYQGNWLKLRGFEVDYIRKIGVLVEKIKGMSDESE